MGRISKFISDLVLRHSEFIEESERKDVQKYQGEEFSYGSWNRLCRHQCGCHFPETLSSFLCFLRKHPYLYCVYAKVVGQFVYPQLRDAAVWYVRGTENTLSLLHALIKSGCRDRFTFMSMFYHWHTEMTNNYSGCKDIDKWIEDNRGAITRLTEEFCKVLEKQALEQFVFGMKYEDLSQEIPMQKMLHDVNAIILTILSNDFTMDRFQSDFVNRDYLLYICEKCLPQLPDGTDVGAVKSSFDAYLEQTLVLHDSVCPTECRLMTAYANLLLCEFKDIETEVPAYLNKYLVSYEGWKCTRLPSESIKQETFTFGVLYSVVMSDSVTDPVKCKLVIQLNDSIISQYHCSVMPATDYYRVSMALAIYANSIISTTELERFALLLIQEVHDIYHLTYILSFTPSPYSDKVRNAFLARYNREVPYLKREWQGTRYEHRIRNIGHLMNKVITVN